MQGALKGVPVQALQAPAEVANLGDWTYAEYAQGGGVQQLGIEESVPLYPVMPGSGAMGFGGSVPAEADASAQGRPAPSSPERNRILDIFR